MNWKVGNAVLPEMESELIDNRTPQLKILSVYTRVLSPPGSGKYIKSFLNFYV